MDLRRQWKPVGSGLNAYSNIRASAMAVGDVGNGPELFVGGVFDFAGGIASENIARWNGMEWNAIDGDFVDSPPPHPQPISFVTAIAATSEPKLGGPAIFVTGQFETISGETYNGIAKWDGQSWSQIDGGLLSNSSAGGGNELLVFDDGSGPSLYVAGDFTHAGATAANDIARWDGSEWFALGDNVSQHGFEALGTFDDGSGTMLVATGHFQQPGSTRGIGMWHNGAWMMLAPVPSSTFSLKVLLERKGVAGQPSQLYLGGHFTSVDGIAANKLAVWDGAQWSEVSGGVGKTVTALALGLDGVLHVGSAHVNLADQGAAMTMHRLACKTIAGDVVPTGGDGIVNVDDLIGIINSWGPCDDPMPGNCPADIAPPPSRNGIVDLDDLLMVINNWS